MENNDHVKHRCKSSFYIVMLYSDLEDTIDTLIIFTIVYFTKSECF